MDRINVNDPALMQKAREQVMKYAPAGTPQKIIEEACLLQYLHLEGQTLEAILRAVREGESD